MYLRTNIVLFSHISKRGCLFLPLRFVFFGITIIFVTSIKKNILNVYEN